MGSAYVFSSSVTITTPSTMSFPVLLAVVVGFFSVEVDCDEEALPLGVEAEIMEFPNILFHTDPVRLFLGLKAESFCVGTFPALSSLDVVFFSVRDVGAVEGFSTVIDSMNFFVDSDASF